VRVFDERVHDRRALLEEGAARQRHERAALEEAARNLRSGDRLEPSGAQVAEDPAVVAKAV
jgi:hypothetical protein